MCELFFLGLDSALLLSCYMGVNLYIEQQVTSSWPSVFLLCGLLFLAVLLQTLLRGPQTVHMSQAAGPPSCVTDLHEVNVDIQN